MEISGGDNTLMLLLFLIVFSSNIGLFKLEPLFYIPTPLGVLNAKDTFLIVLLIFSLPSYLSQRRKLRSQWFHRLELIWIIFIAILAVQALRSPASTLTERFVNLRFVQGYLLFFPSVAILNSELRIRQMLIASVMIGVLGTLLTIGQSLVAPANLFDSPLYLAPYEGNEMMVGDLTRVNIPISNWIAYILLIIFAISILRWRWSLILLASFFLVAIVLNFSRSLWIGLAGAFCVEVILLYRAGVINIRDVKKLIWIPLGAVIVFIIAPLIGFKGLSSALFERLDEGIYIFGSQTGTWGVRLDTFQKAIDTWRTVWLFGVGTNYYQFIGAWIDLGLPATLLSIGIFGLIFLFVLFLNCAKVGIRILKEGVERASIPIIVIGVSVPAQVTLMIIYQQWLVPAVGSILGFSSAAVSIAPLFFQSQKTHQ